MLSRKVVSAQIYFIFLVLFCAFSLCQAASAKDPHDFSSFGCNYCHEYQKEVKTTDALILKEDIDTRCVKCHGSCDHAHRHLGSSTALSNMKKKLPLGGGNQIACFTCHDPHMTFVNDGKGAKTQYLRMGNLKRELCLNCHRVGKVEKGNMQVTFPPNRAVVQNDYLPLIGRVENVFDTHIRISINNSSFPLGIQNGLFYTWLKVHEGMNVVELEVDDKKLWRGEIFRSMADNENVSYNLMHRGHQTSSRLECLGCHSRGKSVISRTLDSVPRLCYRCHTSMGNKKYVHGPLAVGECLSCHDPHGGFGEHYLKRAGNALCLSCHTDTEVVGHRGSSPVARGLVCVNCHDPHQSEARYLIKSPEVTYHSGEDNSSHRFP